MNQTNPNQHRRVRRRGMRPLILLIVITAGMGGLGTWGFLWWQERPLRQATAFLEDGEPEQALSVIDEFLRDHPKQGAAMSLRARILVALAQPTQAIDLFERFGASNPKEIHAWAQGLLQLRRWREALTVLEHLSTTDVDRADVLHELAACRSELGDLQGALAAASEFAVLPGCAARGNYLLGSLYLKRGDLLQAEAAWADVLKDAPDAEGLQIPAAEFFLEYGRMLQTSGKSGLAADSVQRSLNLKPSADGFVVAGDARSNLGEIGLAEKSYKEALRINSALPAARIGLARLALASNDAAAAKEWLSDSELTNKPTREIAVLFQQVTTRLGDAEAAEAWRETADKLRLAEQARRAAIQVLRESPESRLGQVVHAYLLAESGKWTEAELILRPAAAMVEDHAFLRKLIQAIRQRSELPPLQTLPLTPL